MRQQGRLIAAAPSRRSVKKCHDQRDRRHRPKHTELSHLLRAVAAESRGANKKKRGTQNQPHKGGGATQTDMPFRPYFPAC